MLLSANLLVPKKMGTLTQFASLHFKPAHHHAYCLHVNCQAVAGTGWTGWLVNHHWPELCISLNVMWVQGLAEQPIHWSHRVNRACNDPILACTIKGDGFWHWPRSADLQALLWEQMQNLSRWILHGFVWLSAVPTVFSRGLHLCL